MFPVGFNVPTLSRSLRQWLLRPRTKLLTLIGLDTTFWAPATVIFVEDVINFQRQSSIIIVAGFPSLAQAVYLDRHNAVTSATH